MVEPKQLVDLVKELGIAIVAVQRDHTVAEREDAWKRTAFAWNITLTYDGRTLSTDFFTGAGHVDEVKVPRTSSKSPATKKVVRKPTAADVLYSLAIDARCGEQTFEDFCSEFGGNPDSRETYRTWEACAAVAPKLRKFLGDKFEAIANAEH